MKKVNIKIFIIGFSLFRIVIAQNSQVGTWSILNLKYQLTNKISFFGESQLRSLKFYDHFHYYEYKAAINYLVNKSFHATLGAGSYQTYAEGGNFVLPKNNDEFRLWPQFLFFQDFEISN